MVRRIFVPPDATSNLEHSFDRDVRDKLNSDIRIGASGFEVTLQDELITEATSRASHKYKWGNFSENMNGQFIAVQYDDTFTGQLGIDVPHNLKRVPTSFLVLDNSELSQTNPAVSNVTEAIIAPQPFGKPTLEGFWSETHFRFSMRNAAMTGLDANQLFRLTFLLF